MDKPKQDAQTYAIIGTAMRVHRELGSGFLESVYHAALEREFLAQKVQFRRQVEIEIFYRGKPLNVFYRADFVCNDSIIVELKALKQLTGLEEAQVINYLKATGYQRALLINFGAPTLELKRLILSHPQLSTEGTNHPRISQTNAD